MTLDETRAFVPLRLAVVTLSDTRSMDEDRSGYTLVSLASAAGHQVVERELVRDDQPAIEEVLKRLCDGGRVDVVLTTGGTGVTGRDVTPEAVHAVCDKIIPGFGELFRWQSYAKIGTSTIQSRATAGVRGRCLIFALPGSTGAVRDAWEGILASQLDARHRPCNFAELLPRLGER